MRSWLAIVAALVVLASCDFVTGGEALEFRKLGGLPATSDGGRTSPVLATLSTLDSGAQPSSRAPLLAVAMKSNSGNGSTIRLIEFTSAGEQSREFHYSQWDDVGPGICAGPDLDHDGTRDLLLRVLRPAPGVQVVRGGVALVSSSTGEVLFEVSSESSGVFGYDLAVISDIDGDSIEDVAVGEPETLHLGAKANSRGVVEFAGELRDMPLHEDGCRIDWRSPPSARVHVLSGATGATLRTIDAPANCLAFGSAVERIADVDDDGMQDLAAGAAFACRQRCGEGRVLILSARTGALLGELGDGLDLPEFASFGSSIASAPERPGDSAYDLVVGGRRTHQAYLMRIGHPARTVPLHRVVEVQDDYSLHWEEFGAAASACFDLDGDHFGDWSVLGSAHYGVPSHRGVLRVFSGFDGRLLTTVDGSDRMRIVGLAAGDSRGRGTPVVGLVLASQRFECFELAVARARPRAP